MTRLLPITITAELQRSSKGDPGYVLRLPDGWTVGLNSIGTPDILVKKPASPGVLDPTDLGTYVGIKVIEVEDAEA